MDICVSFSDRNNNYTDEIIKMENYNYLAITLNINKKFRVSFEKVLEVCSGPRILDGSAVVQ